MAHRNILYSFGKSIGLIILLLIFRCWYTHTFFYTFILWNLLLAFVPCHVSQYMTTIKHEPLQHLKWWICFIVWLLFFPNTPYIVTDLIHITKRHDIPKWYDAAMIFCAASTGLWIGCISLIQMETMWQKKVPAIPSSIFIAAVFLLCGFGIYLGRVLRFNSWDILSDPFSLLRAVCVRIFVPWQHLYTWGITFVFAGILWIGYQQVKQFTRHQLA